MVKNGDIPSGLGVIHRGYMYAIHPNSAFGGMVKLGPGDFYGEMGMVRGMRSPLIIQTVTNCEVWVFSRKNYIGLMEHLPQETKQQILANYLDILKVIGRECRKFQRTRPSGQRCVLKRLFEFFFLFSIL